MAYVTTSDGVRLYWEEQGRGEPLLLIAGLGGTHMSWHRTVPLLADRYRVITYDARGVGDSDVPRGHYSMPLLAKDALAVLDDAGIGVANIFGMSMGGMVAQELAIRHPDRVRSVILGCTSCRGLDAVSPDSRVLRLLVQRAWMPPDEAFRVLVPFIYHPGTAQRRIDEDASVRATSFPSRRGYLGQLSAVASFRSCSRLAKVRAPTLLLHGADDDLVPAENSAVLSRHLPGARQVLLEEASHMFTTDQPEGTRDAVVAFLESLCGEGQLTAAGSVSAEAEPE